MTNKTLKEEIFEEVFKKQYEEYADYWKQQKSENIFNYKDWLELKFVNGEITEKDLSKIIHLAVSKQKEIDEKEINKLKQALDFKVIDFQRNLEREIKKETLQKVREILDKERKRIKKVMEDLAKKKDAREVHGLHMLDEITEIEQQLSKLESEKKDD
ncbi:MAG: hypothetical protein AABY22_21055 [Nanoarchaeota archaeon]